MGPRRSQARPYVDPAGRQCERTGVWLVPAEDFIWRLAKESWGPLNPRRRPAAGDRSTWSRYDVAGHSTVYGGHPEVAAYAESLAEFKVALSAEQTSLRDLFDEGLDDVDPDASLLSAIDSEWDNLQHMRPGQIPRAWRAERRFHRLTPPTGWFVDVERSQTISAVSQGLRGELAGLSVEELTTGNLRGEDRMVTTTIAGWLWALVLDDGSLPLGVRYGSKHDSSWSCWAVWLRATDDGNPSGEQITASDGAEIADCDHNRPLAEVARLFRLTCH